jgi:hypothetical protein
MIIVDRMNQRPRRNGMRGTRDKILNFQLKVAVTLKYVYQQLLTESHKTIPMWNYFNTKHGPYLQDEKLQSNYKRKTYRYIFHVEIKSIFISIA